MKSEKHKAGGVRQPGPAGEPCLREWRSNGALAREEHWVDGKEVTADQARRRWDWVRRAAAIAAAAPSSLIRNVIRCL